MKQCEDGVHFEGPTPTLFRIANNTTLRSLKEKVCRAEFTHLLDKISHGIGCGDWKEVIEISYHRAVKVVKNCLFHDVVEIKCDSDVVQMIQRWKDVQRISKHVIHPCTSTDIELFIQTRDIRPPTPQKYFEDIQPWLYKNARGGLSRRSRLDYL